MDRMLSMAPPLVNSKNPFEYQGLSATYKQGVNHLNGQGNEPSSPQPMYEASIRYAKAFNNKFAFKVNASYSAAEDWYGTDQSDLNSNRQPAGFSFNPGENRVNVFGDEVATNVGLLANSGAFQQAANANGLGSYLGLLPNQVVTRTGYDERDLVDYNAKNFKLNGGLYYRITNKAELSVQSSTTVQVLPCTLVHRDSLERLQYHSKHKSRT